MAARPDILRVYSIPASFSVSSSASTLSTPAECGRGRRARRRLAWGRPCPRLPSPPPSPWPLPGGRLTNAKVAVPAAVLGAAGQRVGVGQLHQVDHLGTDPQPGPSVGQLVVRAVGVDLQAQGAAVEVKAALQAGAQQRYVVHACGGRGAGGSRSGWLLYKARRRGRMRGGVASKVAGAPAVWLYDSGGHIWRCSAPSAHRATGRALQATR